LAMRVRDALMKIVVKVQDFGARQK
jgi:hypothetical protein